MISSSHCVSLVRFASTHLPVLLISFILAHNGDQFDFPIIFHEIQCALGGSRCLADPSSQPHCQVATATVDNSASPSLTDAATQTISSRADHNQLLLTSTACADSLAFFRHLHRSLNDEDLAPASVPLDGNAQPPPPAHPEHTETPAPYVPSADPELNRLSLKLSVLYQRELPQGTFHLKAHQAESDCLMLLAVLKRYLPRWLDWIESNHHPLSYFSSTSLFTTARPSPQASESS